MLPSLILTPVMFLLSLCFCGHPNEWMVDGGIGYREAEFDWNIGGVEHDPDILSELSWKDLRMVDLFLEGDWKAPLGLYLKANGELGILYHGRNRDSDYAGDGRTEEFSRSHNRCDRGFLGDASFAVGRNYMLRFFPVTFYPNVGYSVHHQHLTIHNGVKVVDEKYDDLPIEVPNLHSSYNATWHGPFLGLDGSVALGRYVYLRGGGAYHWALYKGHGKWNLRADLPNGFDHYSHGRGHTAFASLEVGLGTCWTLGVMGRYQHFWAKHGVDKGIVLEKIEEKFAFFKYEQPFNDANLRSYSLLVTLTARF